MADGMLDPLDNFVGRFRMMCGGGLIAAGIFSLHSAALQAAVSNSELKTPGVP